MTGESLSLAAFAGLACLVGAAPASAASPPVFTGPTPLTAGANPQWVTVADVNGDARPDLITTSFAFGEGAGNTVLINTTTPGAPTPTFTGPTRAAGERAGWVTIRACRRAEPLHLVRSTAVARPPKHQVDVKLKIGLPGRPRGPRPRPRAVPFR